MYIIPARRMVVPNWVGVALGGFFALVLTGSSLMIFQRLQPPVAAAVLPAASDAPLATPVTSPAPTMAAAPVVATPPATAPVAAPARPVKHAKWHRGGKKHALVASRTARPVTRGRKAHKKDDIDKLLGL